MPLGHKLMRRKRIMAYCLRVVAPWRAALFDSAECDSVSRRTDRSLRGSYSRVYHGLMQTTVVEVREPHLFCCHVHMLLIEDTCMSDECIECVFMSTAEVVD